MGSTPPGGLTNSLATNVNEAQPTTNFNANIRIHCRTGGGGDQIGYLYFARPFPLKATIISAKIKFYTTSMTAGTHRYEFLRLGKSFSVSKVTWNTRPTTFIAGTKVVTKTGVLAERTEWELDVTDWMQTVAAGGPWFGVHIVETEAVTRYIYSDGAPETAYRPRLEVTWSDNPAIPTGLAPSGGRAVGLAKPLLKATYLDVSGSTQLQAVQVQLNATDVWTAPSYDSGWAPWPFPEFDLNNPPAPAPAYAGLADGATTYWRVRFQDAAGLPSPWSASTSFKYDSKGVLTVTNPPVGTPVVEDTTPPITWGFTGEVQAAYQVQIRHVENGVQVLDWDSGKVTSTATAITVPTGKITEANKVFTVAVRVWDAKQREQNGLNTPYAEVVRDFTYVPGATAVVSALTATGLNPRPRVLLQWTSATFPDRFYVVRNGKQIATLDPVNTLVSGTTHSYIDETPSPKRLLTYVVQRVVNNVASGSNPTATVTLEGGTIWLREPVSGLEVCLTGRESRDFTLGEQGAALQPIAPDANKVIINQSLGGLEGRISGDLFEGYGKTAAQWRDNFLKLRDLRVKTLLLTVNDYTFSVVAREFTYSPQAIPLALYKVSFAFYQQDSISSLRTG